MSNKKERETGALGHTGAIAGAGATGVATVAAIADIGFMGEIAAKTADKVLPTAAKEKIGSVLLHSRTKLEAGIDCISKLSKGKKVGVALAATAVAAGTYYGLKHLFSHEKPANVVDVNGSELGNLKSGLEQPDGQGRTR